MPCMNRGFSDNQRQQSNPVSGNGRITHGKYIIGLQARLKGN